MTVPKRSSITESVSGAIAAITPLNGYRTAIGDRVFIGGQRTANVNELPCCIVTPGPEEPAGNADPQGSAVIAYSVAAFANRRDEAAQADRLEWETIDAMLADVRQAIEAVPCAMTEARSITYQGADPVYSGGDTEPCGVTVRYSIITKQD